MRQPRLFALAAVLLAAPLAAQGPARHESDLSSIELENGLQVLVIQNAASPFVTVQMVFRAGSHIQMTTKEAGFAHLLEHMLFRRGDEGSIDSDLNEIEAFSNGSTNTESVRYYFTFPAKNLNAGVEIMSKMVRKPAMTKKGLDAERLVVRGELELKASEPDFHLLVESDAAMWGDAAWSSRSPGGNILALNDATPERLTELYKRYYVPNNAALIVAGAVTDTAVFTLARRVFKDWKKGPDPFAEGGAPAIKPLAAPAKKVITGDVKDVTFMVRWHGPGARVKPADTHAADVFAGLINQPLSKARRRLIDGGIVDELSFGYETLSDVGAITLTARTSEDRASQAARVIGEEVLALSKGEFFTEEDLALAKKWQQVAERFRVESASVAADLLADFWASAGLEYYKTYATAIDKQTMDEVKAFSQSYLAGKPNSTVVMIPRFAAPTVRPAVELAISRWAVK